MTYNDNFDHICNDLQDAFCYHHLGRKNVNRGGMAPNLIFMPQNSVGAQSERPWAHLNRSQQSRLQIYADGQFRPDRSFTTFIKVSQNV